MNTAASIPLDLGQYWTILGPLLMMSSMVFIIFGLFSIARKMTTPSYMDSGSWGSVFMQFVFGGALLFAGTAAMQSNAKNTDDESSDAASSSTAPSHTVTTPPSSTTPSVTATPTPSAESPSITTAPTTQPAPEPREPINIPWDIIGIVVLSLIALCVLGFITTLIIRKLKTARNKRVKLQREIEHIRDTYATQLREIMAAFTVESTNPVNTLKYPLYRAADHPVNRAYVNAMMTAYKEQDALDTAIATNFKRKPELISTVRFEEAVQHTTECWDKLNYEAKKIGSPLIGFTTQRKANNLLQRALDEDNYAAERDAAMSRLIDLLQDARTELHDNNSDDVVLVDVMLDALTDAHRNGNTLLAPNALRELTAAADTATQQDLNLPALTA